MPKQASSVLEAGLEVRCLFSVLGYFWLENLSHFETGKALNLGGVCVGDGTGSLVSINLCGDITNYLYEVVVVASTEEITHGNTEIESLRLEGTSILGESKRGLF